MNISAQDIGIKAPAGQEPQKKDSPVVEAWLREIADARKREKDFRKEGRRFVELYEGGQKREYGYNILYSNTDTLLPALYNSTPRPVTSRRFKDEDPIGKMAATAVNRTLEYLIDNGDQGNTPFDDAMKQATLEALVPGRGLTRVKYEAVIEAVQNLTAAENSEGETDPEEEGMDPPAIPTPEEVQQETIVLEDVPWDRFLHGNAKKWKDVPWVAFQHFMTREELEKSFGEIGAKVPVVELMTNDEEIDSTASAKGKSDDLKDLKVAEVYEVWDKDAKKVLFISPQWKAAPLKEVDDPLRLTGFFPCPKPLQLVMKINSLTPVALYQLYEEQAKELNRVSTRINRLIAALKVRGLYDATVEGIDKVLAADDNTLIATENVAALVAQGNALEKAVWLFPIDKIIAVLQQLYLQRQQTKQVIYEITGIADIMRGSSAASETLGAQQIKNQWGTLRLKKAQKEVARYCRDCLRIMAELAVSKLSPQTLRGMTGLPYPMQGEKQQLQLQVQQAQQQAQQVQIAAQQQGRQPPQPPQIPPEVQAQLQMPSWESLLGLLRNDLQRSYHIDIETNSTVDAEATEDKQDMGELLNAISQFLNGVTPLVEAGVMPFEVAKGILLAVVRRYRLGPDIEDQLRNMQAPPQQGGQANAEAAKQQKAELDKQAQQLAEQAKQVEAARAQASQEVDAGKAKIQMEQQAAMHEIELERKALLQEKQLVMQAIDAHKRQVLQETELELQKLTAKHDQELQAKEAKLQRAQNAHSDVVARFKQEVKQAKPAPAAQ